MNCFAQAISKEKNTTKIYCDLHTHSCFSDGTYTPTELVEAAKERNLIVALCDHNTVSGLSEFTKAAREQGVIGIPGVEFSTEYQGKELHIVGLFIQERYYGEVERLIAQSLKQKEESNRCLIQKLNIKGYDISYEELKKKTPDGYINRAHIAALLTERGYISSIEAGFDGILSEKAGLYVPPKRLDTLEVIRFLRKIYAVPVIAHPYLSMSADEVESFMIVAKEAGLIGMETQYSLYDQTTEELAKKIATKYGMKESGGSDFHGSNKPTIMLGSGKGNLKIPYKVYKELLKEYETGVKM